MNNIARILDRYNGDNMDEIIANDELARDIHTLGESLDNASNDDRTRVREFLNELMLYIQNEIETKTIELAEKPRALEQIQKITDACIAYNKPTGQKG